jgi:integrase
MLKLGINVVQFSDWPVEDQAAWKAALFKAGPFDDSGSLAPYPEVRLKVMLAAYGRWLGFIVAATGRMPASGLVDCDDRALLDGFLTAMRVATEPCTVRAYMTDFFKVCRALAPEQQFELVQAATRHVWRTAKPGPRKIGRMVPARDLYGLGLSLMAEAAHVEPPLKQASVYRDGLMIAMLIAAPVRLGNFISIDLGRHLVHAGRSYRLRFAGSEVKNRRPIDLPLPAELSRPIEHWIEEYRPRTMARQGRWYTGNAGAALWVSEGGDRYRNGSQIRVRIERQTLKRFGAPINPHLFRDIAATSIATEVPYDVGIIQTVLGHASQGTGARYYNQARSLSASRAHQNVLERFRLTSEAAAEQETG